MIADLRTLQQLQHNHNAQALHAAAVRTVARFRALSEHNEHNEHSEHALETQQQHLDPVTEFVWQLLKEKEAQKSEIEALKEKHSREISELSHRVKAATALNANLQALLTRTRTTTAAKATTTEVARRLIAANPHLAGLAGLVNPFVQPVSPVSDAPLVKYRINSSVPMASLVGATTSEPPSQNMVDVFSLIKPMTGKLMGTAGPPFMLGSSPGARDIFVQEDSNVEISLSGFNTFIRKVA